jgi:hypothetical protein
MSVSDHSVGSELLGYRIESFLGRGHGDLFAGLQGFQTALASVQSVGPLGQIWLDQIDQAVGPAYPSQYLKSGGGVGFRPIQVVANADEFFGASFHPKGPLPSLTYAPWRYGNPLAVDSFGMGATW